ncbi:MAG: NADH-quinone oxidoreductase subunit B [Gemmatimonadota bacterium]
MAAVDLPAPRLGPAAAAVQPVDAGRWRLWVFDAGLACCAVECAAALRRLAAGPQQAPGPDGQVNVLLVAGTVTDKLAPLVLRAYQDLPGPRQVISFGACSNSGGPYWDSYCVTKGVDQFVPVDVYVPGCPPRPEALLHGLGLLASGQQGSGVQQDSDARPGGDARQGGQG